MPPLELVGQRRHEALVVVNLLALLGRLAPLGDGGHELEKSRHGGVGVVAGETLRHVAGEAIAHRRAVVERRSVLAHGSREDHELLHGKPPSLVPLLAQRLQEGIAQHPAYAVHHLEAVAHQLVVGLLRQYRGAGAQPLGAQAVLHVVDLRTVGDGHADERLQLARAHGLLAVRHLLLHALHEPLVVVNAVAGLFRRRPLLDFVEEREDGVELRGVRRRVGLGDRLGEARVEPREHVVHRFAVLLDLVQLLLHLRGVADVEERLHALHQPVADEDTSLERHQLAVLGRRVFPGLESFDGLRVR